MLFLVTLLLSLLMGLEDGSAPSPGYFKAAVVEYAGWEGDTSDARTVMRRNLQRYEETVESAAAQGAQVVVFPELGLTSGSPKGRAELLRSAISVPELGVVPCRHDGADEMLVRLSCAARAFRVYLVVNMFERVRCDSECHFDGCCPPDGHLVHNTDVAFHSEGRLVAKYRKWNVYNPSVDRPDDPQASSFVTDFGVEIGLFTCFDILFAKPYSGLSAKGINVFAYPTAWVDELPFLTAIQMQLGWAFATGNTLLAAGYHKPSEGALGSGIYLGRKGALNFTYEPGIITANIPLHRTTSELDWEPDAQSIADRFMLQEDLSSYASVPLDPAENRSRVCHSSLCCELRYEFSAPEQTPYRLVAFSGRRSVNAGRNFLKIEVCAVLRCSDESPSSCGKVPRVESNSSWTHFDLRGNIGLDFYMPTGISESLVPLPSHFFRVSKSTTLQLKARKVIERPLAIGVFARDFEDVE